MEDEQQHVDKMRWRWGILRVIKGLIRYGGKKMEMKGWSRTRFTTIKGHINNYYLICQV